MQDRPNIDELLRAVQGFLHEDVMPGTSGRLSFHARVAGNAIQWIRRELELEDEHLQKEWAGLDRVLGETVPIPFGRRAALAAIERRNEDLSARIREGAFDGAEREKTLVAHLRETTRGKLEVTNPRLLGAAAS